MQQAAATTSGRREEWRKPNENERIIGPVVSTRRINGKQYGVVSGGPNQDRSAQRMILVPDAQAEVLQQQRQTYKGRCISGEMVRDSSMSVGRATSKGR